MGSVIYFFLLTFTLFTTLLGLGLDSYTVAFPKQDVRAKRQTGFRSADTLRIVACLSLPRSVGTIRDVEAAKDGIFMVR